MERQLKEYTNLEGFRYERKYTTELNNYEVEQYVKLNPASFSKIFEQRYINNVYLDTQRLDFFYDNVSGKDLRCKYRIRWYGDLFGNIEEPMLEIKIKQGNVGTKQSFLLQPFNFTNDFCFDDLNKTFAKSTIPANIQNILSNLKPVLVNRYLRKYFLDFSKNFRLTIDSEIYSYPALFVNFSKYETQDLQTIIELKYDEVLNDSASQISNYLPFRLTKNSKYTNGIQKFYNIID